MTTYYVSWADGADANNGLGPDASAVTNKPWKSLGKALGASGIASGDTVYVAPGSQREAVTIAMTSPTVETTISGDPKNAQGFKTALGVTVAPAPVVWTGYTTNDTTAPTGTPLNLAAGGSAHLTFQGITFVGGTSGDGQAVHSTSGASTNVTFRACAFLVSGTAAALVLATAVYNTPLVWLFDRCVFVGNLQAAVSVTAPTGSGADYDVGVTVQNCVAYGCAAMQTNVTGALAGLPGGGLVTACSVAFHSGRLAIASGASLSRTYPLVVTNCTSEWVGAGLTCTSPGQLVEDGNVIYSGSPRTNISIGPRSIAGAPIAYAPLYDLGQNALYGRGAVAALAPMVGSPQLAFGHRILAVGRAPTVTDDATVGSVSWTNPTNAAVADGANFAVATSVPATTGVSHYLNAQAFAGFAGIPSNATIRSVRVEAVVSAASATAVACSSVKLVKAGAIAGNDLAASNTTQFTTTMAIQSWGNTSDPLWGLALTPSDVQAAGFGCVFAVKNTSGSTVTANVDMIRVIVAYTTADGHGGVATDLLGATRPIPEAVGALEYSAPAASGGVSRGRAVNMGGI